MLFAFFDGIYKSIEQYLEFYLIFVEESENLARKRRFVGIIRC